MQLILIASLCFCVGAILASKYKIFVLVPSIAIVAAATASYAAMQHLATAATLIAVATAIVAHQVGYLAGCGIISAIEKYSRRQLILLARD